MGKVVCFVGPSGVGKSSYVNKLKKYLNFEAPLIATTRSPRDDDDNRYRYINIPAFKKMVKSGNFIEWDKYGDYYYGTIKDGVFSIINMKQKDCVLDLTPAGCKQVKKAIPNAQIIALLPDDPSWLKKRLLERGTNHSLEIIERTKLLEDFIDEVRKLRATTVYCKYSPSSWDATFKEIVAKINE